MLFWGTLCLHWTLGLLVIYDLAGATLISLCYVTCFRAIIVMEHNLWIITFVSEAFIGNKDLNGYLPYGHYNDIIVIADHVIHLFLLTPWSLEKWPFYINLKPIFKDSSTRFAFTTLTCDLDGVLKMKVSVVPGSVLVQSWSRFTSPCWVLDHNMSKILIAKNKFAYHYS